MSSIKLENKLSSFQCFLCNLRKLERLFPKTVKKIVSYERITFSQGLRISIYMLMSLKFLSSQPLKNYLNIFFSYRIENDEKTCQKLDGESLKRFQRTIPKTILTVLSKS